jgi:glycosyltransferase involved in cell wall biosynthesis
VARQAIELRLRGFVPDLICVHAAWGEGLYLRDVFPTSRILGYFEFCYHGRGADVGFDPEFPATLDDQLRVRTWNMTQQATFFAVDRGLSPTRWQAGTFPPEIRQRLSVIHDGIDTGRLAPDPQARFALADGRSLTAQDEVITFVSRGLEPYRGFHVFMRALPELMRRRPAAQVVAVGGDAPSYGRRPEGAASWREKLLAEVGDRIDPGRLHFTGKLPYERFVALLQLSRAHVYLSYPFVLSWSMLEAMAVGAPVAASATAPVTEVIAHERNGLLFDFFDRDALVAAVCRLLDDAELRHTLAAAARRTVVERYDLGRVCLPAQARLIRELLHAGPDAEAASPAAP